MPWCFPCDRSFITENGYNQHLRTSAAHRYQDESSDGGYASSEQYSSSEELGWQCDICDRVFGSEHSRHQHYSSAAGHSYCVPCRRIFMNENNLRQHLHSKLHMGGSIECPFCSLSFTTASGVTIHLESGACTVSGLDRSKINRIVRQLDRNHVITKPMLTMSGYDRPDAVTRATERSWNGRHYECYLCAKQFGTLQGVNAHLASPVHEQKIYRCPKGSCGREYKALSGLVQHVESEICGVMRFAQVQKQARSGIQNMVGRMIGGY
ncbi:uncharacterized protein L3040_002379 [Drepanopeziza brunnea f. sp. 'multigermtubi']|uniref:Zinc finger protein n=1 Tax=Marssonina brunnea f. sp. multigermtubi (strain MB_m1) TaxID=1072389 RepID=K1X4E8_MARBU|nr:zinc finger protein [Drepanopeziza brunnea f. sp. 'multigermtubi' MB_m1]EKD19942.1 zinc finger protein [Drepanopeziza brunnea f. sp. 'multigermtubi' MB_m1]KAJ5050501.1 hypothetical protein L3040_002379 [Drepanopeziza brunnea f. sp. 'multigermtubi']